MSQMDQWIEKEELGNCTIKWNWSHFDGNDPMSGEGKYNFTVVLPEDVAKILLERGWTGVKENDPYEEGDAPEWTLKIQVSDKFGLPPIYFIKSGRKIRVRNIADLADIRRDTCENLDVIISPSRWEQAGGRKGVSAYVAEMFVEIKESRFASKYADMEEV